MEKTQYKSVKMLLWATRNKRLDVIILSEGLVDADTQDDLRGAHQPAFGYFFLWSVLLWIKFSGSYLEKMAF